MKTLEVTRFNEIIIGKANGQSAKEGCLASMSKAITQITRRDIIDAVTVEKISWTGRLEETEFLSISTACRQRIVGSKTRPATFGSTA